MMLPLVMSKFDDSSSKMKIIKLCALLILTAISSIILSSKLLIRNSRLLVPVLISVNSDANVTKSATSNFNARIKDFKIVFNRF